MGTKLRKYGFCLSVFLLNTTLLLLELDYLFRRTRNIETYGVSSTISEETAMNMQTINSIRATLGQGVVLIAIVAFIIFIYKSNNKGKYFLEYLFVNVIFILFTWGLSVLFPFHIIEITTPLAFPLVLNGLLGLVYLFKTYKNQNKSLLNQ
jgi:hypothetical protein